MDHAHVEIIRLQELHHLLEARPRFLQVPRALVLPVLPDRADMGLDAELLPPPGERIAHRAPHVRIRGVEVEIIDPLRLGQVKQLLRHPAAVLGKAFTAHADFTDLETGIAQFTILRHANAFAAFSSSSRILMCCGHAFSQAPHFTQSAAGFLSCRFTSQFSWLFAAALSPYSVR